MVKINEAIIKNARITGSKIHYDEKAKSLVVNIGIEAKLPNIAIEDFLSVQKSDIPCYIHVKAMQAEMEGLDTE